MKTDLRGHLSTLESEAIYVLREVGAQFERPVLLFSGGKDSIVIVLAGAKAFWPGAVSLPAAAHRHRPQFPGDDRLSRLAREDDAAPICWCATCRNRSTRGASQEETGPDASRNKLQTVTLLDALAESKFDAAFGGARRDEEKARAKERFFSHRDAFGQWDPKNQRPELWNIFNGRKHPASTSASSR